jgi:aminopeptidase N
MTEKTVFLKDYKALPYRIKTIDLHFDLHEEKTIVTNTMSFEGDQVAEVVLNGEQLELLEISYNQKELKNYKLEHGILSFLPADKKFTLKVKTKIDPKSNTALEGLYWTKGIFCTQNEAEGFRKITFYYDRPDSMSSYTTKISADKTLYPTLLANGNLIESGELENNRHFAVWKDPFPKPCYLFALVAGSFDVKRDYFTTKSGRVIKLEIYVDKGNLDQTDHAMGSLQRSFAWDEQKYGLEYDLDIYMILAVDAFNMGAMENKGLNIFNSKFVLGNLKTATDEDFFGIESVVGHEYFHNWTGNRVTCRDWFQLTLKEGLTVFRDQEFSGDLHSKGVQRIDDVNKLRSIQWVEDDGPFSHPIRPEQYIEINNFYTATIYEKGAEVIRMIQTIIGEDQFKLGLKKYFELYDGMAVTTEDFINAMAIVSKFDFKIFKNWYSVSGIPQVKISRWYDEAKKEFVIEIKQGFKDSTKNQTLSIPLNFRILGEKLTENQIEFSAEHSKLDLKKELILLQDKSLKITFKNITKKPVLSINRGFSAPVMIDASYTLEELAYLAKYDDDHFNRWDALQQLYNCLSLSLEKKYDRDQVLGLISDCFGTLLKDGSFDDSFKALFFEFPSEMKMNQQLSIAQYDEVAALVKFAKNKIANDNGPAIKKMLADLKTDPHQWNAENMGKRALKFVALNYCFYFDAELAKKLTLEIYESAVNMTDEIKSLALLNSHVVEVRDECNEKFFQKWKSYPLIVDKYIEVQVGAKRDDLLSLMKKIESSSYYEKKIPNKIRSLMSGFARNLSTFHSLSGEGYDYFAKTITEVDSFNPQIAARLSKNFVDLKKLDPQRRKLERVAIEGILKNQNLSKDSREVLSKYLE